MGAGQVKTLQSLLFLPRFSHFFKNNTPWIVEGLWLISRVLKKLNLTVFASVIFAVMEKCILGHSYTAMPEMLPLTIEF